MQSINTTYRILAISLAALMCFTSVGFTVDMHFCCGKLKTISVFGKAKSCHQTTDTASMRDCPRDENVTSKADGCTVGRKKCCENRALRLQADQVQDIQTSSFYLSNQIQHFIVAFVSTFLAPKPAEQEAISFWHYKPPMLQRDILVLVQSFLL